MYKKFSWHFFLFYIISNPLKQKHKGVYFMVAVMMERFQVRFFPGFRFLFLFGLFFAQVSNFAYFGILDFLPEFFDIFLIISLFLVILDEYEVIPPKKWINYLLFLGAFNNFLITYFFFLWGYIDPTKDLAFVQVVGLPALAQIIFDAVSLFALLLACRRYKSYIVSKNDKMSFGKKVLIMEFLLLIAVYSEFII